MELEEEIELDEDMCKQWIEKWRYMYLCRECAMFDCSMEDLKKNRVKIDKCKTIHFL